MPAVDRHADLGAQRSGDPECGCLALAERRARDDRRGKPRRVAALERRGDPPQVFPHSGGLPSISDQRERRQHGIQRGAHMRFRAAHRREAKRRQSRLEWGQIAAPKGEVIRQVARGVLKFGPRNSALPACELQLCAPGHILTDFQQGGVKAARLGAALGGVNFKTGHPALLLAFSAYGGGATEA